MSFSPIEINRIERFYIDKGWTVHKIAKSMKTSKKKIKDLLLSLGLEVEGKAPPGCVPSSKARCAEKAERVN